jgi:hypothetical protein
MVPILALLILSPMEVCGILILHFTVRMLHWILIQVLVPLFMFVFASFAVHVSGVVVLVLLMLVNRSLVNTELGAFDVHSFGAFEMHVELAEFEFGELPFERRRFHAEVAEGADGHIAADAGKTVEKEDFHRNRWDDSARLRILAMSLRRHVVRSCTKDACIRFSIAAVQRSSDKLTAPS